MSDLITKLNYTKQTKDLIMQSLIDQGQEISSDTPFRNYAPTIEDMPVGCKLFETIQDMNNDDNPKDGDLALVYREDSAYITEDTEFSSCTFPAEVVLTEAVTTSNSASFRTIESGVMGDGNASISSTDFRFDFWGDEMIRITYTSADGITYTRTDNGLETVDFGITLKYYGYGDPLDSNITKFMLVKNRVFDGIFEYDSHYEDTSTLAFPIIDSLDVFLDTDSSTEKCYDIIYSDNRENFKLDDIIEKSNIIYNDFFKDNLWSYPLFYRDVNDNFIYMWCCGNNSSASNWNIAGGITGICLDTTGNIIGGSYSDYHYGIVYATIDPETDNYTITYSDTSTTCYSNEYGGNYARYVYNIPEPKHVPVILTRDGTTHKVNGVRTDYTQFHLIKGTRYYEDSAIRNEINKPTSIYKFDPRYISAPNQLTIASSNQLLPDITAYGNNGVITGDTTIYDNIPANIILSKYFNLPLATESDYYIDTGYAGNITNNKQITYIKKANDGRFVFGEKIQNNVPTEFNSNGLITADGNYIITMTEATTSGNNLLNIYDASTKALIRDNIEITNYTYNNNFFYGDYIYYILKSTSTSGEYDLMKLDLSNSSSVPTKVFTPITSTSVYGRNGKICNKYLFYVTNTGLTIIDLSTGTIVYTLDSSYVPSKITQYDQCGWDIVEGETNIYLIGIFNSTYTLISINKTTGTFTKILDKVTSTYSYNLSKNNQQVSSLLLKEDNDYLYVLIGSNNLFRVGKRSGVTYVTSLTARCDGNNSYIWNYSQDLSIFWVSDKNNIVAADLNYNSLSSSNNYIDFTTNHIIYNQTISEGWPQNSGNLRFGYHYIKNNIDNNICVDCKYLKFDYNTTNKTYTFYLNQSYCNNVLSQDGLSNPYFIKDAGYFYGTQKLSFYSECTENEADYGVINGTINTSGTWNEPYPYALDIVLFNLTKEINYPRTRS